MIQLEGNQFISRLTLIFDKARTKGHVQLTMKKHDGKKKNTPKPDERKPKNKKVKVIKP